MSVGQRQRAKRAKPRFKKGGSRKWDRRSRSREEALGNSGATRRNATRFFLDSEETREALITAGFALLGVEVEFVN